MMENRKYGLYLQYHQAKSLLDRIARLGRPGFFMAEISIPNISDRFCSLIILALADLAGGILSFALLINSRWSTFLSLNKSSGSWSKR